MMTSATFLFGTVVLTFYLQSLTVTQRFDFNISRDTIVYNALPPSDNFTAGVNIQLKHHRKY